MGVQTSTGDAHAFLATPIHSETGSESVTPAAQCDSSESGKAAVLEMLARSFRTD